MNLAFRLLWPALQEAIRARWLVGLSIALAVTGELLIRFAGGGTTTLVSLMEVALLVAPLAAMVVGAVQVHNAREVIELLLAQPIGRSALFAGLYLGLAVPLATALAVGLLAPFAWHGLLTSDVAPLLLGLTGVVVLLACVGTALAFGIALRFDDRVRALSIALAVWLLAGVLWDGIILLTALVWSDHPVELPLLALLALNPLDIARVMLLLGTDGAALLGYTGAVVQHTLGTLAGRVLLGALLTLWSIGPLWWAHRAFRNKDF